MTMTIVPVGIFTGKERGYATAYPETSKVVYHVYKDENGKEYGIPQKAIDSGDTIEALIARSTV